MSGKFISLFFLFFLFFGFFPVFSFLSWLCVRQRYKFHTSNDPTRHWICSCGPADVQKSASKAENCKQEWVVREREIGRKYCGFVVRLRVVFLSNMNMSALWLSTCSFRRLTWCYLWIKSSAKRNPTRVEEMNVVKVKLENHGCVFEMASDVRAIVRVDTQVGQHSFRWLNEIGQTDKASYLIHRKSN